MKKVLENRILVYFFLGTGVICLLIAVYFSVRTVYFFAHRPPHLSRATDTTLIQPWMNISYISRMYKVPEPVLFSNLGVAADHKPRISLTDLSKEVGKTPESLVQSVREIVTTFQNTHPFPSANNINQ